MPRARTLAVTLLCLLAAPAGAGAAYFDVGKLPPPNVSGVEIAQAIEDFVTAYPLRVTGTTVDEEVATYLADEAKKLGYATAVEHPSLADGAEAVPTSPLHAVTAIKKGTTRPDEHILFMGHYDTVAGFGGVTLEGAYDNGSGTMFLLALAKALANVPTNRSLMFVWYNGEEEGVLASDRHAETALKAGLKVRAALGFDMVGIAHPVATPTDRTCLCMWHGSDDEVFEPLLRHINFSVMGLPDEEGKVQIEGINARNSDESSWDLRDQPTLRWAGMRAAADYPAYHCPTTRWRRSRRSRAAASSSRQGLREHAALGLSDRAGARQRDAGGAGRPPPATRSSSSMDRLQRPGRLSLAYTWDFGDGATGSGARASHDLRQERHVHGDAEGHRLAARAGGRRSPPCP